MKTDARIRSRPSKTERRRCQAPECSRWTNQGKPYCQEHCDLNPYARLVAARLEAKGGASVFRAGSGDNE